LAIGLKQQNLTTKIVWCISYCAWYHASFKIVNEIFYDLLF